MSHHKQPIDQHDKYAKRLRDQRTAPQGSTGLGGGLVGAAIGGLLGRRVGGVSGAVVGAVAGALLGKGTAKQVNRTVDGLVDAAKSVAEAVNQNVNSVGNAVKDTVEQVKPSVVGVAHAVKDTVEQVKPSVVGAAHAVKDTVEQVKPSVVGAAKNVAEAVNYSINDVGNALKNTMDEVKQSVIGVEETAKNTDTDEDVKPVDNYQPKIHEHLVTQLSRSNQEFALSDDVKDSDCQQYQDFKTRALSFLTQPLSSSPLATKTRADFFIKESGIKSQENNQSSNQPNIEPNITEQVSQELDNLQQYKSFEERDIKDIQQTQKAFQDSQQEATQQLSQQSIQPQTEKIQKPTGIILGSVILTLMGITFGLNPKQNSLVIKSSASQISATPEKNPERITTNTNNGWIFLGSINTSDSGTVQKLFSKNSQSTDSFIVPSVGSILTVSVKPGVTLRENKPQAPHFSPQEQKALAVLKLQEKLKILKVELVKVPSTTQSPTKVWAKVQRCGSGACL